VTSRSLVVIGDVLKSAKASQISSDPTGIYMNIVDLPVKPVLIF